MDNNNLNEQLNSEFTSHNSNDIINTSDKTLESLKPNEEVELLKEELQRMKKTNTRDTIIIICLVLILIFLIVFLGFNFIF